MKETEEKLSPQQQQNWLRFGQKDEARGFSPPDNYQPSNRTEAEIAKSIENLPLHLMMAIDFHSYYGLIKENFWEEVVLIRIYRDWINALNEDKIWEREKAFSQETAEKQPEKNE
jgi:hypothetical protein